MKLAEPIIRGDTSISEVALRRPDTGALRGLKLTDVMQMDVNAMTRLLPRITEPALLPAEIEALSPVDLLSISTEVVSFFVTAEQLKQVQGQ